MAVLDLNKSVNSAKYFSLIENYIYMSHLDKFLILPVYPETITDSMAASYTSTTPLSRSAPIFAYSNSGPRTIDVTLNLHRDLMQQVNTGVSNVNPEEVKIGDDYIDYLIKNLQSIAVPKYAASTRMVNPPQVSVRFGNEIYIHGIINGNISVTYKMPLLDNNKYSQVTISFTVSEVDPYSAETIAEQGSFRGLNKSLERRLFKK